MNSGEQKAYDDLVDLLGKWLERHQETLRLRPSDTQSDVAEITRAEITPKLPAELAAGILDDWFDVIIDPEEIE